MIASVLSIGVIFVTGLTNNIFPGHDRDISSLEMATTTSFAIPAPATTAANPPVRRLKNLALDHTNRQCMARRVFAEGGVPVIDCYQRGVSRCRVASPLAPNVGACEAWYIMVWHQAGGPDLFRRYEATLFYKHDGERWRRLGPTTWIYYPWKPLQGE